MWPQIPHFKLISWQKSIQSLDKDGPLDDVHGII
jgi:hypothetical protein